MDEPFIKKSPEKKFLIVPLEDKNNNDCVCACCGIKLSDIKYLLADQTLCDDCYISKITAHKPHKTYYDHDTLGYLRRLKENEPVHPQKFH